MLRRTWYVIYEVRAATSVLANLIIFVHYILTIELRSVSLVHARNC